MLDQIESVLSAVEEELSKHGPGMIDIARHSQSANDQSVNALFANSFIRWINLIVSSNEVLLTE